MNHHPIYDDKGNEIEMNNYKSDGTLVQKETYKYTYDSKGNWIQKSTYEHKGADNIIVNPVRITKQAITYYD